jgi:hypothetical protein
MDELSYPNRSRRRSRSRSRHRSRSRSPHESTIATEHNQRQTQYIPIPVPYYQPQAHSSQPAPMTSSNTKSQPVSYLIPQAKQQFINENNQSTVKNLFFFSSNRKIFSLI